MDIRITLQRRGTLALVIPVVVATACSAPTAAAPRPVAGCYHLQTSAWEGEAVSGEALPGTVRLLEARGVSAPETGKALLRAWPDSLGTVYRWSWWEVAPPDTLTLVFSTGRAGSRLVVRPVADGFAGQAVAFADDHPASGSTAWARLRPLSCSAGG